MALVVEDGTGLANAESFASVAEANVYHTARGREATWTDLDTDVKERALRLATDFMQQTYRSVWAGVRKTTSQLLDWPRWNVPKRDDPGAYGVAAYYDPDVVPTEVKRACMELALRATTADLNPDLGPLKTKATVGPISVEYAAGTNQTAQYAVADDLLAPLMLGGMGSSYNAAVRRG